MLQITVDDKSIFAVDHKNGEWFCNGEVAEVDVRESQNGLISIIHNGKSYRAIIEKTDITNKEIVMRINGQLYRTSVQEPIDQLLASMGIDMRAAHKTEPVKAPMPGMVLKILVTAGQEVKKGDKLLILEAMKMENVLKAASDGIVKSILVAERVAVEKGAVLIELE